MLSTNQRNDSRGVKRNGLKDITRDNMDSLCFRRVVGIARSCLHVAIVLMVFAALPGRAIAACAQPSIFEGGPHTYYGRLSNGRRFGATLDFQGPEGTQVAGRVFIAPDFRDVPVSGTISNRSDLKILSLESGRFEFNGVFLEAFEDRKNLTCDVVAGTVSGAGAAVLTLDHISGVTVDVGPELEQRNVVALAVHNAIIVGDSKTLSKYIHYPIDVQFDFGKRHVTVKNEQQFLHDYPKLIDSKLIARMKTEVPHDIFCRDVGCMLADGRIWFDDDNKIYGLSVGW